MTAGRLCVSIRYVLLARRASEGNPQNATRYRTSPEFTTNHTKYTNKENANEEILHGVAFQVR